MTVKIDKPIRGGKIRAIASKSAAHRLLICAALADAPTFVGCSETSEDIAATADCLRALGAVISEDDGGFGVTPINGGVKGKVILNCGESGSTLRFLLPVCGALGADAEFEMGGRLPSRPLTGLYEEMVMKGCALSEHGKNPLKCSGMLRSGKYSIPGNVSSQFVSGLLFALPLLRGDSEIAVEGDLESRPYVDMTLDALGVFGVEVTENGNSFFIKGGQTYRSLATVQTEGDWSNAAFWLAMGEMGAGNVEVSGLDTNSRQGDRLITELLARFKSSGTLRGIEIDASHTPDLVPILAAAAAAAEGRTVIYNAERLRLKESDRLKTVCETLKRLGADVTETDGGLIINGRKTLRGGEVQSFGDHRIVMMAAAASAVCENPVIISGAEAVNKSYPTFFKDFTVLGGEVIILGD